MNRATMPEVIGRGRELAVGEALLDAVEHGPASLVLEGEAGIVKTTVWAQTALDL